MRRSSNKLCAETHYERYTKCLLGIISTELAAQHVSRSEESKVIRGNPFLENTYIIEQNLISYIRYYIQIPNTCFVQPFSHLVGKSRYADQKYGNMCCSSPRYLSLHYTCHQHSRPLRQLLLSSRAFFVFKKQSGQYCVQNNCQIFYEK